MQHALGCLRGWLRELGQVGGLSATSTVVGLQLLLGQSFCSTSIRRFRWLAVVRYSENLTMNFVMSYGYNYRYYTLQGARAATGLFAFAMLAGSRH